MEELRYAYGLTKAGIYRVVISNIKQVPIYKMQFVLPDGGYAGYPHGLGLFTQSNAIHVFGGMIDKFTKDFDFESLVLKFDHDKFENFPDYIQSLKKFPNPIKQLEKIRTNYVPMVLPGVIPAGDKTYFISDSLLSRTDYDQGYDLQHFDANTKCFVKHPKPPLDLDGMDEIEGYGHFLFGSYLYLFVCDINEALHVYVYNTELSKWTECRWLAAIFNKKGFPAPIHHRGDVGISDELFLDGTRIMVALCGDIPVAYRIEVVNKMQMKLFEPKSYRLLLESYIPAFEIRSTEGLSQLADFGDGRFCVVYGALGSTKLLMYVFSIDFSREYNIQRTGSSGETSSTILSSRIFSLRKDFPDLPKVPYLSSDVCFLPAASPTTSQTEKENGKGKGTDLPMVSYLRSDVSYLSAASLTTSQTMKEKEKEKEKGKGKGKGTSTSLIRRKVKLRSLPKKGTSISLIRRKEKLRSESKKGITIQDEAAHVIQGIKIDGCDGCDGPCLVCQKSKKSLSTHCVWLRTHYPFADTHYPFADTCHHKPTVPTTPCIQSQLPDLSAAVRSDDRCPLSDGA